jgi:Lon protease-like protein
MPPGSVTGRCACLLFPFRVFLRVFAAHSPDKRVRAGYNAGMPEQQSTARKTQAVALFPLPNVVLFPRVVLPLHIFEERYKAMTADALAGDRQIAMALLRPGWEKNYHGVAPVDPVVCIGKIIAHEKLPDGRYNLLLQGLARANIVRELQSQPYRVGELSPMEESPSIELDLSNHRGQMIGIFSTGRLATIPLCRKFLELLAGSAPTSAVVDLVAFNLIDDVQSKQRLLADPDPVHRAERVVRTLQRLQILSAPSPDDSVVNATLN